MKYYVEVWEHGQKMFEGWIVSFESTENNSYAVVINNQTGFLQSVLSQSCKVISVNGEPL